MDADGTADRHCSYQKMQFLYLDLDEDDSCSLDNYCTGLDKEEDDDRLVVPDDEDDDIGMQDTDYDPLLQPRFL